MARLVECEPEIGTALWWLEETRRRTKQSIEGIAQPILDWIPSPGRNSIGTILYHVAAIEMDWLYADVLQQEMPAEVEGLFPEDVRDAEGRLTRIAGRSLAEYFHLLDATRAVLLDAFRGMSLDEFCRVRRLPNYDVTPEWVLFHLTHHEASHQGELTLVRSEAQDATGNR